MKNVKLIEVSHPEFETVNKKYKGSLTEKLEDGDIVITNPTFDDVDKIVIFDADKKLEADGPIGLQDFGKSIKGETITILSASDVAHDVTGGIMLGYEVPGLLKTDEKSLNAQRPVVLDADGNDIEYAYDIDGVLLARELANLPGNHLNPFIYMRRITDTFKKLDNVTVKSMDKASLQSAGFNTLLSVAQGSDNDPYVVTIEYKGDPASDAFELAYVGKGVTFDSGGISLKPGSKMHEMKMDMGGSAAVVGAMYNLAKSRAEVNVVAIVGLVENMPSGRAIKPGDVVTSLSGKTVENHNTDAEGRLVLCDLITHIQNEYPTVSKMVDVATLTGAILVALADEYAGLFSNSTEFADRIRDNNPGEKYWRMPMGKVFAKQLDSNVADMKNIGNGHPGSTTAAEFLYKFVNEGVAWAHLDIAGTGMVGGKGTGFGVRTLTDIASVMGDYPIDDDMKY